VLLFLFLLLQGLLQGAAQTSRGKDLIVTPTLLPTLHVVFISCLYDIEFFDMETPHLDLHTDNGRERVLFYSIVLMSYSRVYRIWI
jgi:hypothetical protein